MHGTTTCLTGSQGWNAQLECTAFQFAHPPRMHHPRGLHHANPPAGLIQLADHGPPPAAHEHGALDALHSGTQHTLMPGVCMVAHGCAQSQAGSWRPTDRHLAEQLQPLGLMQQPATAMQYCTQSSRLTSGSSADDVAMAVRGGAGAGGAWGGTPSGLAPPGPSSGGDTMPSLLPCAALGGW